MAVANQAENEAAEDNSAAPQTDKRIELTKLVEVGEDNNYAEFEIKSQVKLEVCDLWKYIEGPEAEAPTIPALVPTRTVTKKGPDGTEIVWPQQGNEEEVEEAKKRAEPWYRETRRVKSLIVDALPQHRLYLVKQSKTAKDLWVALKETYRPTNELRVTSLKTDLIGYVYEPGMDVIKWKDNILAMYHSLLSMDPTAISDDEFARQIITLMPIDGPWQFVSSQLHNLMITSRRDRKPLESREILAKIVNEHWRINRRDERTKIGGVMSARVELESRQREEKMERGIKRSASVNQVTTQMPNKRARRDRSGLICANEHCERPRGHTIEECIAYGGGKVGQYWEKYKGPRDIHLHPVERNRQRRATELATGNRQNRNIQAVQIANEARSQSSTLSSGNSNIQTDLAITNQEPFYTFTVSLDSAVCNARAFKTTTAAASDTAIYHDSGATRHVFSNKDWFHHYECFPRPLTVKGFDSSLSAAAVGKGTVLLEASCGNKKVPISLRDVLHVPAARCNLVSQSQLDHHGVHSQIGNGRIYLSKQGDTFLEGHLDQDLYRLSLTPIANTNTANNVPERVSGSAMEMALQVLNMGGERSGFYIAS